MNTYPLDIREEELKLRVAKDFFANYDTTNILGNIDFAVAVPQNNPSLFDTEFLLWAEAKQGSNHNIYHSFVQLILTIGKARTFDKHLPPRFLAAFDAEKIAFIPYDKIIDVFYQNDFNWNVTPSNHDTKEFQLLLKRITDILQTESLIYYFQQDEKILRKFIKQNFVLSQEPIAKARITKNNFVSIFNRWLTQVFPSIDIKEESLKKLQMQPADFYFADILSKEEYTLHEKLFALLRSNHYDLINKQDKDLDLEIKATAHFKDQGKAHAEFWAKYQRPPKKEYWGYILERRDLLVPQDIRERKGSFFTPRIWVEKSQEYLAEVLGEDWQDEYVIWDCCAGTGNLLANLTNKYNIWASTLDEPDVKVMKDQISHGLNMLEAHIFQFDFLNDPFSKLPQPLQDIINNPEKRKKLLIYINPPYAEVSSVGKKGKAGVNISATHQKYTQKLGTAGREIYVQFMARIYDEINSCRLAEFSKLKTLQGAAFSDFRQFFKAKLEKAFVVPANTFDNVSGKFPIGFKIWNTDQQEVFTHINADVYSASGEFLGIQQYAAVEKDNYISNWVANFPKTDTGWGFLAGTNGNDFQQNNIVYILNSKEQMANPRGRWINETNLIFCAIYFAVRHAIEATWLNDRDQFLMPNEDWKQDELFQSDCLAYTLFHPQNRVSSAEDINHWIPFYEDQINTKDNIQSHFMADFINGKLKPVATNQNLFQQNIYTPKKITFSIQAQQLFNAAQNLYTYYHQQTNANPNASLYDIKLHFQGKDSKGKMNPDSKDETYTQLLKTLKEKQKALAQNITPKIYQYGFLK